jgi:hypothetical protein
MPVRGLLTSDRDASFSGYRKIQGMRQRGGGRITDFESQSVEIICKFQGLFENK